MLLIESDFCAWTDKVKALTALGYGSAESLRAVKKVSVDCASVEDLLREALKNLL